MGSGKVYLVGAGPGAPDLLTVRATTILARAEIVFYDALVNPDILDYCRPECSLIAVGTRGSQPVLHRQELIHQKLAEAAQTYNKVVRLKGGDPGVFGRGGEEMVFLTEKGITWEVVPGISAGVGGLSAMGLTLTHRDISSCVTLLPGSQVTSGMFDDLPLSKPLSAAQTLVFYMPVRNIDQIVHELIQHGLDATTPSLCVSWLSYPQQVAVCAPLDHLEAAVATSSIEALAIMVVGNVVGLWDQLRHRGAGAELI